MGFGPDHRDEEPTSLQAGNDRRAHYHGRDMAVCARISPNSDRLASATPSGRTESNARKGRYQRVGVAVALRRPALPHIEAIDLRRGRAAARSFISRRSPNRFSSRSRSGTGALFSTRRGSAADTMPGCAPFCLYRLRRLAGGHRFRQRLVCHHCGFSMRGESAALPGRKRWCGRPGASTLQKGRPDVPNARPWCCTSDLITRSRPMRAVERIAEAASDIIVGTQLGRRDKFSPAQSVGVVDADLGLGMATACADRTFQLLNQVIGACGREQARGRLSAEQPARIRDEGAGRERREAFYCSEIEARERAGYPPFGRLASLIISAGTGDRGGSREGLLPSADR